MKKHYYGGSESDGITPYRPLELMLDERMTDYECKDFIAVWEKFVPASFCEQLIKWFEHKTHGHMEWTPGPDEVWTGEEEFGEDNDLEDTPISVRGDFQYGNNLRRKDLSVLVNYCNDKITHQINQFLKSCMGHYITEFGQLDGLPMFSSDIKMQKTSAGGGYHLWHYENSGASHASRELVWMIYLNDLEDDEGGETEFMYQHRRIKPTVGTVVIFPAGMTHVHKGNTVLKGDKYILTGWYIKAV